MTYFKLITIIKIMRSEMRNCTRSNFLTCLKVKTKDFINIYKFHSQYLNHIPLKSKYNIKQIILLLYLKEVIAMYLYRLFEYKNIIKISSINKILFFSLPFYIKLFYDQYALFCFLRRACTCTYNV